MLRRLEQAFERMVEGSVASVFRLQVQPAEIGRRLERAMLDKRVTSMGTTLAPNAFEVHLHPDDAASFEDWQEALSHEMETWLSELAYARGISTVGNISVGIVPDPSVRRRSVQVAARFDGERPQPKTRRDHAPRPQELRLVPVGGRGRGVVLSKASVAVGRAESNDLVLADSEVSRHHARIERHGGGWVITDLESTNGTWVNGERIRRAAIAEGDDLAFGQVQFTIASG